MRANVAADSATLRQYVRVISVTDDAYRLEWTAHLRVSSSNAAERVIDRIRTALGRPLEVESVEPYWKIPELYAMRGRTPLAARTWPEAVLEALTVAGAAAHRFDVAPPSPGSFEGRASVGFQPFRVAGIEFLTWRLVAPGGGSQQT